MGCILYFLYGSLVFWSVGAAFAVLFISLMFIDIEKPKQKAEKYSDELISSISKAIF
jgi:preprotein translocase subunit YajC